MSHVTELALYKGGAPWALKEKVSVFYHVFAQRDDALAGTISQSYAGREATLFKQLEARYAKGVSFLKLWSCIEHLFILQAPERVDDVGKLLRDVQPPGLQGVKRLLRQLQAEYSTSVFTDSGLLSKRHSDYNGHREMVKEYFARHEPSKGGAVEAHLRTFKGKEEHLVSLLEQRYAENCSRSVGASLNVHRKVAAERLVPELASRDAIVKAQASVITEQLQALRRVSERAEAARAAAPSLLVGALHTTNKVAEAAVATEDVTLAKRAQKRRTELRSLGHALRIDVDALHGRPAVTATESDDFEDGLAELRAKAASCRPALKRLASFFEMDAPRGSPPSSPPRHREPLLPDSNAPPVLPNDIMQHLVTVLHTQLKHGCDPTKRELECVRQQAEALCCQKLSAPSRPLTLVPV
ncbi:hypothetical protein DIPPA_06002 [Diplonema papillatum]|nr:hypothetical protein DIPPA_06002 [Diplonema papillatum]